MAYAWNGHCYETGAQALTAFNLDLPSIDGAGVLQLLSSSVDANGLITATARKGSFGALSMSWSPNTPFTYQLPTCTYDSLGQFWTTDIVFVCAMVFAAFAGFRTGFRP